MMHNNDPDFPEDDPDNVTISIPLANEHPSSALLGIRTPWYKKPENLMIGIFGILVIGWFTSIILAIVITKSLSTNIAPVATGINGGINEIKNLEKVITSLTTAVEQLIKKIP